MKSIMCSDEFAKMLGRNEKTVRNWCREGKIPAVQAGVRWYVNVEEWLKPSTHNCKSETGVQQVVATKDEGLELEPKYAHLKYW